MAPVIGGDIACTCDKQVAAEQRMTNSQQPSQTDEQRAGADALGDEPTTIQLGRSFQIDGQLPLNVLPPEAIERLLGGGQPTPSEVALIRSAALRDAGPLGRLLDAVVSSGVMTETTDPEQPLNQTFEWKWAPKPSESTAAAALGRPPVTYYEALSGRPDPHRDFFVAMRRLLNAIGWVIALSVPIGLVALAFLAGEPPETVFFAGFGGLIFAVMVRRSMVRTPFG